MFGDSALSYAGESNTNPSDHEEVDARAKRLCRILGKAEATSDLSSHLRLAQANSVVGSFPANSSSPRHHPTKNFRSTV
jgi:hypothetical protein